MNSPGRLARWWTRGRCRSLATWLAASDRFRPGLIPILRGKRWWYQFVRTSAGQFAGVLVAGVSVRLKLDELYFAFYELVAGQIATAVANARAYEEERKRAEALAKIDRAKTQFFSSISHEFRTPLTLMLRPVGDLLDRSFTDLSPSTRGQLEIVHRNALRLLKLVNTMLDFSRIEAGRIRANYEETDLPAYTADLASSFRSACERAGLSLKIDCPPPTAGAAAGYVDRDMWEKIVLNLLSNAFKFTFEGGIEVSLTTAAGSAELAVRDTGAGIAADELPRVFERFHRVNDSRGRTHEGTGIGLALVLELAEAARRDCQRRERAGPGKHVQGVDAAGQSPSRSGSYPSSERTRFNQDRSSGLRRGGDAVASWRKRWRRRCHVGVTSLFRAGRGRREHENIASRWQCCAAHPLGR